jgi:hypothetical protein
MSEQEMKIALSYYVELVKQVLPALKFQDRKIVEDFNKDIERKLSKK